MVFKVFFVGAAHTPSWTCGSGLWVGSPCRAGLECGRLCTGRKLRVNVSKSQVMKCTTMVDDATMNVALNGMLVEEVECLKYLV